MVHHRLGAPFAAVALSVLLVAGAAPAAAEPSVGEWPVTAREAEPGLPRGWEWVRTHPMLISALVVSMGAPPPGQRNDYFDAFGASAVTLWKDGPAEVAGWQPGKDAPFVTWLDDDGTSVVWNGEEFRSTGLTLGGLAPDLPGRIGFQVGDEPLSVEVLEGIEAGIAAVRAADPEALAFTNFSYFVPNRDALLEHWVNNVDADVQVSSDYFLGSLHYTVLEKFRDAALRKGVPYWEYLNAYVGAESNFAPRHTPSDLRWQAMAGLTYGFTGHIWFFYQAAAEGHPTATDWGGSVLHDGIGSWSAPRTGLWGTVAQINRQLANLGKVVTQLTSTDVRLIPAVHPLVSQPGGTRPWSPGAGGDPYLVEVGPGEGEGPMDILVGHFAAPDGEPYVMVQNARHTHSMGGGAPPLPSADLPGRVRMAFDFTDAPFWVDRSRLEYLDPNDGKVRVLQLTLPEPPPEPPPEGQLPPEPPLEISTAEVVLQPGEALLFKYADTIPFRLGPRVDGAGLVDRTTGVWYLRERVGVNSFYYGNPGDVPFMGDWDCDGVDTPGLYRQSDGFVYLRNSNTQGIADVRFFFGNPGDVPLAGDFDGDGCDTVSLYRPDEARVFVINRLGSGAAGLGFADLDFFFGDVGDEAFAGDFDGDGIDTVGVRRRSIGQILLRNSLTSGAADVAYPFGNPGDLLVVGDWEGDGTSTAGLFRSPEARFYLTLENEGGAADIDFLFGESGWTPVAGAFGK